MPPLRSYKSHFPFAAPGFPVTMLHVIPCHPFPLHTPPLHTLCSSRTGGFLPQRPFHWSTVLPILFKPTLLLPPAISG